MATVVTTRRETNRRKTNRRKWAILQFAGLMAVACVIALVVYQVGRRVA